MGHGPYLRHCKKRSRKRRPPRHPDTFHVSCASTFPLSFCVRHWDLSYRAIRQCQLPIVQCHEGVDCDGDIITVRQRSCGNFMFSQVSVILLGGGGMFQVMTTRCHQQGGGYVSSDDHQVSLVGGWHVSSDGHLVSVTGVGMSWGWRGMSRGHWGWGWVCHGTWDTHPLPTPLALPPSGSYQNMCGWQAGGTHPTGMLSYLD